MTNEPNEPPATNLIQQLFKNVLTALIVLTVLISVLNFSAELSSLSLPQLIHTLSQIAYLPNHNAFAGKSIGPLNLNVYLGLLLAVCLIVVYLLRLTLFQIFRNPILRPTLKTLQYIAAFFLCLVIGLQTKQQAEIFRAEFQQNHDKSIDEKYSRYLRFNEDYKFARFCQRHLPAKHSALALLDWDPSSMKEEISQTRWAYLRYFFYPLDLTLTNTPTDYLIAVFNTTDPQKSIPPEFEIWKRFDSLRLIARRKEVLP